VLTADRTPTGDGYEKHLAINHLAAMLLIKELLPLLRASAPARVINLAGGMPRAVDLTNLDNSRETSGMVAYSHSKSILMAASYELATRLDPSEITVNVAYPGGANTPMTQNISKEMLPGLMRPFAGLMKIMMRNASPTKATRSSVRLATDPGFDGVTGQYLHPSAKEATWPAKIIDGRVREEVWQMTERELGPMLETSGWPQDKSHAS
jgi:NAD(P)-dependent dehydrogenase (short-subunit alcohol dehydrogenase family)